MGKILVFKFVTSEFLSPGNFGEKIDYSGPWPKVIEDQNCADAKRRLCAPGIRVIPLDYNFHMHHLIVFSDKVIIGEVDEKDVVFSEGNGLMRVRKMTVLREATSRDKIREMFLDNPKLALSYAKQTEKKPHTLTRQACLSDPYNAYYYALHVDKKPRTDTRNVALGHPDCAYNYALDVDKKPRTDTRKAVLNDPSRAYNYALHVDKKPRADTRKAVKRTFWAAHYKRWENSLPAAVHNSKSALNSDHLADIKPRTDIKNSAFADPFFAYFYAQKIDGKPRQETRSAVLGTRWEIPYKKWEDSLQKDVEQS